MTQQLPALAADRAVAPVRSVTWWLRLTSYGWDRPADTLAQRELMRRSQLASWVILTLLVVDALLVLVGLSDFNTLVAVLIGGVGFLFAAYLNRRGHIYAAGGFLIALLCAAILGAIISQPQGLLLDLLPAYDIFLLPTLVAASILPRRSAFAVAALTSILMVLDFRWQPHAPDLERDLASFPSPIEGTIALLIRPIALQVLVATIAFLWVRGMERAVVRADQAEQVAALEHAIAEQKGQLEAGVTEIERTLNKVANGHYTTRIAQLQQEQLWRIGLALNNLLNRLQRAANTEADYRVMVTEIQRLAQAIEAARQGKPALWPSRTNTPLDLILVQINEDVRRQRLPRS